MVPVFHHKLLVVATASSTVVGGNSRSTLFHNQIFTKYCSIREIVERWNCVLGALQVSTALQVLVLIGMKCGSNWYSSPNQYNGESGLCSLSVYCQPEVAIYKQVLDRSCMCMSLFCGFQCWACVRRGRQCAAIMPEPQGFMGIPLDSHLWLYETLKFV